MRTFLSDLRYGFRLMRQSPGFTAIAVIALALGIGANTVIFSTFDSVLLRPLPYQDPDRVVMVWEDLSQAGFPKNTPAVANFADWRRMNHSFTDMAATRGQSANFTGDDAAPEQVFGRAITANFFSVLGVTPLIGRTFTDEEDRNAAQVVVISYGLWQRRWSGDQQVLGKAVLMDGNRYTIIGVMRRDFVFRNRENDFWRPASFTPQQMANRGSHFLNVVARLNSQVTLAMARADMQAVAKELAKQYPANQKVGAVVEPVKDSVLGNTRLELIVLMGAAGCVLLIACANLAGLLISRAVGRQREMAVRAALGAGRGRLVRQMVTEGVMLALAGGILGLAIAPAGMRVLIGLVPLGLPSDALPAIDLRLLGFTLALSLFTGVVFSIAPAIHAARASLHDSLKAGGRAGIGGGGRLRDALVVLEVSSALVLLVCAGLMIQTMVRLRGLDLGFNPEGLLTARTILPNKKYDTPEKRQAFFDRVLDGLRTIPGVESVAYSATLPFEEIGNTNGYSVEGKTMDPNDPADALIRAGTEDCLRTLGLHLIEGRLLDQRDRDTNNRAVVLNATFAKKYWPKESALGGRIHFGPPSSPGYTVVGVVDDVRERGYDLAMKPGVYLVHPNSIWQLPYTIVARAKGDPMSFAETVRRVVHQVDPDQPVAAIRTMEDVIALRVTDRRQQLMLLAVFAGLALALAAIGLYGVLSHAVTQRNREIGVRIALGASGASVVRLMISRGLALTGIGLVIGIAIAWAATQSMKQLLFGVSSSDPVTYAGVAGLLALVALAACWIPAARAARVDPVVVLREE
jgi:putative ABC transport system permease protein